MAVLIAAVVLVGLLGLVNLLFCFGVIRRLREHTDTLDKLGQHSSAGEPVKPLLEVGSTIPDFTTHTVDGEPISAGDLTGTTLLGVFSPGCPACEEQVDPFIAYATTHPGGRSRTLALVVGAEADSATYVERLEAAARVVREPRNGSVSTALAVRGYPSFALLDGNLVRASGFELDVLPTAVAS